jgi:hypothetical protein
MVILANFELLNNEFILLPINSMFFPFSTVNNQIRNEASKIKSTSLMK